MNESYERPFYWTIYNLTDGPTFACWYEGVDAADPDRFFLGHDEVVKNWASKQAPGTYRIAVRNGDAYLRFSEVVVPPPVPPRVTITEITL